MLAEPVFPVSKVKELPEPEVTLVSSTKWLEIVAPPAIATASAAVRPKYSESVSTSPVEEKDNPQVYSAPIEIFGNTKYSIPINPFTPKVKPFPPLVLTVLAEPALVAPWLSLALKSLP